MLNPMMIAPMLAQLTVTNGPVFPTGLVSLAVIFFIIAILAYVLGARGVAGMSASIGRTLLFVFLVLFVIMVVVSLLHGGVF